MVKTTELLFDDIHLELRNEWIPFVWETDLDWALAISQLYDGRARDDLIRFYRSSLEEKKSGILIFDRLGDMWDTSYKIKHEFINSIDNINVSYSNVRYTLAELLFSGKLRIAYMKVFYDLIMGYHDLGTFIPKLLYCICIAPLEVANYLDCGFSLEELYNIINSLYENYYTLEQDNIFKNTYCWRLTNSFVFVES